MSDEKLSGRTITDEQIRAVYDEQFVEDVCIDENLAFACVRALLPETHRAFNPTLRDEARERVARHISDESAFNEVIL